jgi:hypothetical protein
MANQHISRLINDPSSGLCENVFAIADTWIIDAYTPGDWNGAAGNLAKFYSDTPGSQATIDISAIGSLNVSYCDFKDIKFTGATVYADLTCTGNTANNSGIVFSLAPAPFNPLKPAMFYVTMGGNLYLELPAQKITMVIGNTFF